MFMGEYNHSIDSKGRLIIPAKFREQLGESFVLTQGLDGCLFIYPDSTWELFTAKMNTLPLGSREARNFKRFFLAKAIQCELDRQGRILVSAPLRKAANLTKDVVLAGVGDHIEVWDQDAWDDATGFEDMDEIAEKMGGLGI